MTKKHYEAIALRFLRAKHTNTTQFASKSDWIAHELADYFTQDNPKFDRNRFLAACGIESQQ